MSLPAPAAIGILFFAALFPNEFPGAAGRAPLPGRPPPSASAPDFASGPDAIGDSIRPGRTAVSPDDLPSLVVNLNDPDRLLSHSALEQLREETAAAFRRSGAAVLFVTAPEVRAVSATLYPEIPKHWRVHRHALGVAVGAPEQRRSVFLSVGAAKRALGLRRSGRRPWPGHGPWARRLGRALGRVLAHELVHAIAPDCPHTHGGLMSARLSRRLLLAPGVGFDETAERHLRRAVAEIRRSRRSR